MHGGCDALEDSVSHAVAAQWPRLRPEQSAMAGHEFCDLLILLALLAAEPGAVDLRDLLLWGVAIAPLRSTGRDGTA